MAEGHTIHRGDFIVITPHYLFLKYHGDPPVDGTKFHLCQATGDEDGEGNIELEHLTEEDTQAMCEAIAHSMKKPKHTVWVPGDEYLHPDDPSSGDSRIG